MAKPNIRFIQTGDWHLFANQNSWPAEGYHYRDSRLKRCLKTIFEAAEKADFLVLTGDLIDLRRMEETTNSNLPWFNKYINSIGRDKVIVTYGSHDDLSVREWLSARTAPRIEIAPNLFKTIYPLHDIIFYAADSAFEGARGQSLKMRDMVELIRSDRQETKANFSRAILVTQLSDNERSIIQPLGDCINFAALGDHHYCRVMTKTKLNCAYAGTPIARDACTAGDCGLKYFLDVDISNDGKVSVETIPLPDGGNQVKVQQGKHNTVTIITGPGAENKHALEIEELQNLPAQLIQRINEITDNQWTSIALADSVPHQSAIIDYLEKRYATASKTTFARPTRKGKLLYFFR